MYQPELLIGGRIRESLPSLPYLTVRGDGTNQKTMKLTKQIEYIIDDCEVLEAELFARRMDASLVKRVIAEAILCAITINNSGENEYAHLLYMGLSLNYSLLMNLYKDIRSIPTYMERLERMN